MQSQDLARAIGLGKEALAIAIQLDHTEAAHQKLQAEAQRALASIYWQQGDHDQSLLLLFQAATICEESGLDTEATLSLLTLGEMYTQAGDYPNALLFTLKSLDILQRLGDRPGEAQTLNQIGKLYLQMGEYCQAIDRLEDCLLVATAHKLQKIEAAALSNKCKALNQLGDHENALASGLESIALYQKTESKPGEIEALGNLGDAYLGRKEYNQACEYYQSALELAGRVEHPADEVKARRQLGIARLALGYGNEAIAQLTQALTLAERNADQRECLACHQALTQVYRKRAEHAKALEHVERAAAIQADLDWLENTYRLKMIEYTQLEVEEEIAGKDYHQAYIALKAQVQDHQQTEEALKIVNQQLHDEIVAREQLISDLNAFSHMVAHDLKSPLHNIITASVILWNNILDQGDAGSLGLIRGIQRMVDTMNRIINELLTLASVQQEDIRLQRLNMHDIIAEVEDRLVYMIDDHHAVLEKPEDWPDALGYTPWIEEVWTNFISNAIKYGGNPPHIKIGATVETDGQVRFWIQDNGDGLDAKAQQELFTAFKRLDKIRARGHGLGLSIVKRIINKLNGQVGVESEDIPGEGCTFSFTLPAAEATDQ
ncbi:MAG: tetratricopeptide repeat protein [Anaerolineales bacterium]|nr:tetratricopeptide repeat protein [Anaerolineales bacterium]